MSKASSFKQNSALERFLRRLPDDVSDSFTVEQLQAMQAALQTTQWRKHPVDIRLTIPVLWKKFYFVLIVGPERRTKRRNSIAPIWTPANILFTIGLISVGMLLSIGVWQIKSVSIDFLLNPPKDKYPAGIPFKPDQESCETSGRIWQNGECIDYDHDPTF